MIKFCAQSARAAGAKSDSTAQRVPSGPTLYRLGCALLRAARLNRLPRNPCSSGRGDTRRESLPTSGGKSSGCDLQSRKQPLDIITFAGILYLPLGGFLLARCFVGLT